MFSVPLLAILQRRFPFIACLDNLAVVSNVDEDVHGDDRSLARIMIQGRTSITPLPVGRTDGTGPDLI